MFYIVMQDLREEFLICIRHRLEPLQARCALALNSTVFLAQTELQVSEDSGVAMQRIVRTGALDAEVRITYGVTGNTAIDGQDFVGGFGTVTMPARGCCRWPPTGRR